ncbi:MAG: hypothetical protein KF896_05980 [Ignavibacteriae bacterium]|nr:hypothetical protein [Ignavibacteriota bacterium]
MKYMDLWRTRKKVISSVEEESIPQISYGKYFNIYPNPASDYITISIPEINPTVNRRVDGFVAEKVQIFDMLGLDVISTPSASLPPLKEWNVLS